LAAAGFEAESKKTKAESGTGKTKELQDLHLQKDIN